MGKYGFSFYKNENKKTAATDMKNENSFVVVALDKIFVKLSERSYWKLVFCGQHII